MQVFDYMNPELVLFLETDHLDETLQQMVHYVYKKLNFKDEEQFLKAIKKREQIVSTGIGMGIAIPHAKLSSLNQFFIVIGILKKGVDWHSLDQSPVKIVFMIGGPDDKQMEYLQILSNLTHFVKNEEIRKKLLSLKQPSAIVELFYPI